MKSKPVFHLFSLMLLLLTLCSCQNEDRSHWSPEDFWVYDEDGNATAYYEDRQGSMEYIGQGEQTYRGMRMGDNAYSALALYGVSPGNSLRAIAPSDLPFYDLYDNLNEEIASTNNTGKVLFVVLYLSQEGIPMDAQDAVIVSYQRMLGVALEDLICVQFTIRNEMVEGFQVLPMPVGD